MAGGGASSEGRSLDPAAEKGAEAGGRRVGGRALLCAIGVRSDSLQIVESAVRRWWKHNAGQVIVAPGANVIALRGEMSRWQWNWRKQRDEGFLEA